MVDFAEQQQPVDQQLGSFSQDIDEGNDGWMASQPAVAMSSQGADAFADFSGTPSDSVPMQMQSQQPVQRASVDDDLTEEEQIIVAAAAAKQEEIKRQIHEKMLDEQRQRDERKIAGTRALEQWKSERAGQINLRKENNSNLENEFQTNKDQARQRNPWEVVCENCDLSVQGVSAGGKDKSRMKVAMVNRKGDNIKPGTWGTGAAAGGFGGL